MAEFFLKEIEGIKEKKEINDEKMLEKCNIYKNYVK